MSTSFDTEVSVLSYLNSYFGLFLSSDNLCTVFMWLDPSRYVCTFCDHTELLWFNPITCQAQRDLRGLCFASLQSESLPLPLSLFQDTRRAIYLIILILCCCIICQNKGQLIIRLSVRAEEKLMMNEDQVKEIIQRWVSQQYFAMATHFSWGYRTQDLLSWCCNEVWPSSVGKNSIMADRLAASIKV